MDRVLRFYAVLAIIAMPAWPVVFFYPQEFLSVILAIPETAVRAFSTAIRQVAPFLVLLTGMLVVYYGIRVDPAFGGRE
jgi:hypothetical protein